MAHRHAVPPLWLWPARPLREVTLDLRVQIERHGEVAFGQLRNQGCCRDNLGQRSNIVHRRWLDDRGLSLIAQFPECVNRDFSAETDRERCSWSCFVLYGFFYDLI